MAKWRTILSWPVAGWSRTSGITQRLSHTLQNTLTFFFYQSMDYDVYRRRVEATGSRKFMYGDPTALDGELDSATEATGIPEMMNKVIEKIQENANPSGSLPSEDMDTDEGR